MKGRKPYWYSLLSCYMETYFNSLHFPSPGRGVVIVLNIIISFQ